MMYSILMGNCGRLKPSIVLLICFGFLTSCIPKGFCLSALLRSAPLVRSTAIYANPVSADGSSYRGSISEDEAFLWFDEALVFVRGGSGGAGSNAFKLGKNKQQLAPCGGSGGNGGSVILRVDTSFNTLLRFKGTGSFKASPGEAGDQKFANGMYGNDFVVPVPAGTIAIDNSTGLIIGELKSSGDQLVIARGGLGGQGNAAMKAGRGERSVCMPPQGGERRWVKLQLKLVADVGLVGVPNAGKSTLLDAITNAKPKIAAYPFTTIVPNLGVCEIKAPGSSIVTGNTMVFADIPGLIEGAHRGVGLGRGFLRHIERCKIIVHIVNGDSKDPVGDFQAINKELQLFSSLLASKPQVVVLNKIDLPHVAEKQQVLTQQLLQAMTHTRLLTISAAGRLGLSELTEKVWLFLQKLEQDESSQISRRDVTAASK